MLSGRQAFRGFTFFDQTDLQVPKLHLLRTTKKGNTPMPRIGSMIMRFIKAKIDMRPFRSAIPAVAVILVTLSGHTASSQTTKTIKVVVPYAPGGGVDFLARLLADQIGRTQG